jgi:hypothetical protein
MYVLTDGSTVLRFPYSIVELRKDNPNTSFSGSMSDEELATWGVFPVVPQAAPACDPATETLSQADPTYKNGKWLQKWTVTEADADEIAQRLDEQSSLVRADRNQRLSACDWTQLPDAPVDTAAWADYRQALRDVTGQAGFPWAVVWPAAPEA